MNANMSSIERNNAKNRTGRRSISKNNGKIIGVIPARYKSSRFPGKPLVDICGKPMVWWTYQQAIQVPELDEVYVATDDQRIFDTCTYLGVRVIMTSEDNKTGTDRVGEVARMIPADIIVNIQGDEPLMAPNTIRAAIFPLMTDDSLQVTNLMARIKDPVELVNSTIPKVIVNKENIGIYMTRATAPYPKGSIDYPFYKQICVYGFRPDALQFYYEYGQKYGKARIEAIEDIELLRFIENGYKIHFTEVEVESLAVDTPNDLEKVRAIVCEMIRNGEIELPIGRAIESAGNTNSKTWGYYSLNKINDFRYLAFYIIYSLQSFSSHLNDSIAHFIMSDWITTKKLRERERENWKFDCKEEMEEAA